MDMLRLLGEWYSRLDLCLLMQLWLYAWPLPYVGVGVYRLVLYTIVAGVRLAVIMATCVDIFGYSVRESPAGKLCLARRLCKMKAIKTNWNWVLHFTPIDQAVSGFVPTLLYPSPVALGLRQSNRAHLLS